MTGHDSTSDVSRRSILKTAGAAGAAGLTGLSGCIGGLTGGGESQEPIELLHAWSSGDGSDAIAALLEGFQEEHPDVEFAEEPVNGAARKNLGTVIQNRMQSNNPPSTWQAWPGKNLEKFAGAYGDLEGDVWDDDMKSNYLPGPKKQAQLDGTYVTVPLNIHRINNLFYNTAVVEEAGVDPSSIETPDDLTAAMQKVADNTDATPMAQQTSSNWSTVQLWATVLLGQAGQSGYNAFVNGNGKEAQVKKALQTVKDYSEFYFDDSASISWTEGNSRFMKDQAAFIHQGDWAAGAYSGNDDFNYGEDWDHVPFPGTDGYYALNMDSFPFPSNNPSPEATKTFLSYCGSTDAQIRFNQKKGSIPPRKDADPSKLNTFQQDQFDDFTSSEAQPPSIQHGLALSPAIRTNVLDAFSGFIESYDVDKTTRQLLGSFS
ncbi:ABC transporter substrate-binding protein [Haloarchaeobius sp. HME9146]|uniref:ABC transporter substrate-binding protein n=1 Tax=Haloarchaeobius sp. HME9146 TaxID=2978732 RepID=UPI0034E95EE6